MKKHHKLIHVEDIPAPEKKIEILMSTIQRLTLGGYEYIGMDHFAMPEDELAIAQKTKKLNRNFQGYSTRSGADLYGVGMSSISHFGTTYAQNAKTLPEYYEALDSGRLATAVGYQMTFDDVVRKFVIMKLMCDLALCKEEAEAKFNIRFDTYFSDSLTKLNSLADDGLVLSSPADITVTSMGRLFLRNIAMCFDTSIMKTKKQPHLYSQTV